MRPNIFVIITGTVLFLILAPGVAVSHCDSMNGPVVLAAKEALESGNVNLVLIWVQEKDEAEIREAFRNTMTVRKMNEEARRLADMYFFETLVRIHRAGEGAPYTGLKPAGEGMEAGIEAADKALELGSADALIQHLTAALRRLVASQLNDAMMLKLHKPDDVKAGRKYVEAYVRFIHTVEGIHKALTQPEVSHDH